MADKNVEKLYHPDSWILAAEVAKAERISMACVRRAIAAYRQRRGLPRLRLGRALERLILDRATAIKAKRTARQMALQRPLVRMVDRWPVLSSDPAVRSVLWSRHIQRAIEQLCEDD